MNTPTLFGCLGRAILCLMVALPAFAATTDLATAPLVTSSSTDVKPNVFLMMDDSGSMDWDFMPDTGSSPYVIFAPTTYGAASAQCNGVFYNPAIKYMAPVDSTGTPYPDSAFGNAWMDGYNTGAGTVNLSARFQIGRSQSDHHSAPSSQSNPYTGLAPYPASGAPAFYYLYKGFQTNAKQKKYYTPSGTFYTECNTPVGSTVATIQVGGNGSTKVNSIAINGIAITSGGTNATTTTGTLAQSIANKITATGYSATYSGSKVTITGPPSATGYTPVVSSSGTMTFTITAFLPTSTLFDTVVVSLTSGLGGKDETTNFANWFSYYRTRINMMKSGTGRAFQSIGINFRVGFATMNNNNGTDMVNLAPFDATQRAAWYSKLYGVSANNSTPLLKALSRVGQMYAYKLPSNKLNTVAVTDPMQYACQQNFAILSTDGFWNDSTNYDLIGTSSPAVGNQDGTAARPYYDGGSTSNTLADVAMYYYMTDLRTSSLGNCTGSLGSDVCNNIVPKRIDGQDAASWQHMTLFTLGLGAPGRMVFSPTYQTDKSGDYFDVSQGTSANPPSVCSWGTNGQPCNWPTPNPSGTPENIDDLWHAAVNGRGAYFSATDPSALDIGLSNALAGVQALIGSDAAATTSNPNITSGDNFVFSSTFDTVNWYGDVVRESIDPTTGVVSTTNDWTAGTAAAQLDALAPRTIYTYSATAATKLTPFVWANLSTTQQAYFPNTPALSQFCSVGVNCLSTTDQTAATGQPLFNFIVGDRTNEGAYYRSRVHILGDIVNAEAVYVKGSLFNYADAGYSSFASSNNTRQGVIYVAANDGMLHAFSAGDATGTGGQELWAYVPTAVIPNLYKLADKNYANSHRYFVDGTPVTGDVYFGGAWHTILVGGLNNGGRSYYALDVTIPTAPVLLWEFTDTNLGYTYGNPVITKLSDGTWAVLVASGYNNVSSGDGQGRVYVLNAGTGSLIRSVSTAVGSTSTPSGLARISAWVDNPMVDNTAKRVYGGDLLGNVWRLDVNAGTVQLLATLTDSSGNAQPITTKPELGTVGGVAVVYVGTGIYLGTGDLSNTSQQTFYAIKDTLGSATYTNPRLYGSFVQQTETNTTCPSTEPATICKTGEIVRTSTSNVVNFATNGGWYIDLPDIGERDNTDQTLALGTLAFTTNVPNTDACNAGGYSYRYFLDYRTGAPVSTAGTVVAVKLGSALGTRPVLVRLPNNTIIELTRLSNGTTVSSNVPIGNAATATRRVGWHELSN